MKLTDLLQKTESYGDYQELIRCNTNGVIASTKSALQNKDTYTKIKRIDGTNRYVWNDEFIQYCIDTLESGEYKGLVGIEKQIMEEYINYINGTLVSVPEYIVELDKKLGEMI